MDMMERSPFAWTTAASVTVAAVDTGALAAVGSVTGIALTAPVIACAFAGCGLVAFMALSLVRAAG